MLPAVQVAVQVSLVCAGLGIGALISIGSAFRTRLSVVLW
jgi:hypothetical protein